MPGAHSDAVENLLRKAGWSEGRQCDVTPWESATGRLFGAARDLLTEFGGLVIGACDNPGRDVAPGDVTLEPSEYYRSYDGAPRLEQQVGEQLYPFGVAYDGYAQLWIGVSGRIYLLGEGPQPGRLRCLGNSFGAALEIILLGHAQPPYC